jgi:outer membrane protein assembly factor BamB
VESSPAVVGGTVFVGSYDGNVYALNASTGAFIWGHTCGAAVRRSSPAVADGKVYIGSGTSLLALNSSTGSSIWGYATSGLVYSSPAVADGTVFVGSLDGNVYAFGPAQAYQYTVATSPSGLGIVVDGTAYVSPQAFSWNSGSVHTVSVSSPQGSYFFANWSDGGAQSHQITVGSFNTTMTAYFNQEVHDVAVLNVTVSKTIIGQTYSMNINVTAANQGSYTEVFNVTAYANVTAVQTETFNITSQNSTTLTFTWNTTGFALGNYTISAYAWPVPGETNTADNNFTCTGNVRVTIPGDVTGDGVVDIYDLRTVACYFDVTDHDPQWTAAWTYDLNGNGVIDIYDLVLIGANFT